MIPVPETDQCSSVPGSTNPVLTLVVSTWPSSIELEDVVSS
ncbi:hypothetical protein EV14_1059 [Prochlorococcus sp. MIT 0703]|nr:hypothetical protein EV14_1059 [Prochlorococcus sp. MIT 0703]